MRLIDHAWNWFGLETCILRESDRKTAEKETTVDCQSVIRDGRSSRMRIDLNLTRTDEITIKVWIPAAGDQRVSTFLCMGRIQGFGFAPVIHVLGVRDHMSRISVLYGGGASLGSYHSGFTGQ